MGLELARKWIGGRWKYVAEEAGGGGAALTVATVTLDDEQIKALPAQEQILVAAPGAGRAVIPLFAVYVADIQVAYTTFDGIDYFTIGTGNDGYELMNSEQPEILSATAKRLNWVFARQAVLTSGVGALSLGSPSMFPAAVAEAEPLTLSVSSDGVPLTGGDPANTLTVTLFYVVVDV